MTGVFRISVLVRLFLTGFLLISGLGGFELHPALALEPARLSFQEFVSGLNSPVFITHAGDGSGRVFVIERSGQIRIIKNGILQVTPFLNIQSIVKSTSGEQGLLALAFHPSYSVNGKFTRTVNVSIFIHFLSCN